ncbi:MAG: hypothetical protein HDT29_03500 [Clostridiales bacterium]|nr:hypothetical protein [Clostridiales bacterium]
MSVKVGDVVISKRGHDSKKTFIVVATLNENYVLIADGKSRKLAAPKQKNVKHLKVLTEAKGLDAIVDDKSIESVLKQMQTE